jgi:16S rRNA (guanine966-N2)-methyltransferase
LRIIGGRRKGRRLQAPSKNRAKCSSRLIRPTADRAREALFSIIGDEVEGATVLDLFAGTGALGLEALSRSAELAVFVDNSTKAVQIISKNIELCGFSDRTLVFKRDLLKGLAFLTKGLPETTFSVVFVDPPYRQGFSAIMLEKLATSSLLDPHALVVIEDDANLTGLPSQVAELALVDQRSYGETGFWFYRQN